VKRVLITGGRGFLGRNLAAHMVERTDCEVLVFDKEESLDDLKAGLRRADVIFHLAGINRPKDPSEFATGNAGFTKEMCELLKEFSRAPKIVFSSSTQAELDNPYGVSKLNAERVLREFGAETGACVRIYRLKNLFGKWCRPNYNAVTATFCHNIARDLPISIADPSREIDLTYVDNVVAIFLKEVDSSVGPDRPSEEIAAFRITLGELAGRIQFFHDMRQTLIAPDFSDYFNRALYATYLSFVPPENRETRLDVKTDARGSLVEFIKETHFGQVFVSRTKPGITRGNHYHHTKTEKFFVVEGQGLIRMRHIEGGPVTEYPVRGEEYQVIDIPPGHTHSITNVGNGVMVTLFWASEVFDPNRPDTYFLPVDFEERPKPMQLEKA
jgi:UDP-2-acetamido-2,6-beta-L-arabino-hexul-4-ose reductase